MAVKRSKAPVVTTGNDKPDVRHPLYEANLPYWERCVDVVAGSAAVKARGTQYLPALLDQAPERYRVYLYRALFYAAASRTVEGLLGALFRNRPQLLIDDKDDVDALDGIRVSGTDFLTFLKHRITAEILTTGRAGVLVDAPSGGGEPYLTAYDARSIINWREGGVGTERKLELVVLREQELRPDGDFGMKRWERYRVLRLRDGVYEQQVHERPAGDSNADLVPVGGVVRPMRRGVALDSIPFWFVNAKGTGTDILKPPLLDLVDVNISHYHNSADIEHGRHFTGLPTPWVAGFALEGDKLHIGSEQAWMSDDPNATAGFLEFTGQGLKALETALSEKEKLMAVMGARLLEAPRNASESAENQRLKRAGEESILASIADSIGRSVSEVLSFYIEWRDGAVGDVSLQMQKEYASLTADPQILALLLNAVMQGRMSPETWFYNLHRMGMVPEGLDFASEQELIEKAQAQGLGGFGGRGDDGDEGEEEGDGED